MSKECKARRGFTLVELLATIFIISLVFGIVGYYVFSTISTSKEKEQDLTRGSIENSARIYVEENPDEVIWNVKEGEENQNTKYSCISILSLIHKNYLKSSLLENAEILTTEDHKQIEYVIVKKNISNDTIVSEELDTSSTCQPLKTKVQIPTEKEYCNHLTYSGEEQSLLDSQKLQNNYYNFQNYLQTNVGDYKVNISLKDQNKMIWSDGTNTDKTITCSIQKAIPSLSLKPMGGNETVTETTLQVHEPISGTITLKSSNKNYVMASTSNSEIKNGGTRAIQLNFLSSRQTRTYITVTFTPTNGYEQNYYSSSIVYTVDNIAPQKVAIPTNDYCNQNLVYNQSYQKLLNQSKVNKRVGFNFYNYEGIDAGTYEIIAQLQYGYIWNDGLMEDKTFRCSIQKATPVLTLSPDVGEVIKTADFTVQATSNVNGKMNIVSADATRVSITSSNPANVIANTPLPITVRGSETTVNPVSVAVTLVPTDTKNYNNKTNMFAITVKSNVFRLTYDANGGNGCNPSSKEITYNQPYGTLCTTTRKGYSFQGWFTAKTGGTGVTASTVATGNVTVYAHWIDNIPPTCGEVTGDSTQWTNRAHSIEVVCRDDGSGCSSSSFFKNYGVNESGTTTDKIVIRDNAGNTTECPVNVYLDMNAPDCARITKQHHTQDWVHKDRTMTVTCSDTGGSGCERDSYSYTYTSDTERDFLVIKDNAGNTNTCSFDVHVDKTPPVCSVTGGEKKWINTSRTIKVTCSDTGGSGCTEASNVTEVFDSGTVKTKTYTVRDHAGNSKGCTANVYVDKDPPIVSYTTNLNYQWKKEGDYCVDRRSETFDRVYVIFAEDKGSGEERAGLKQLYFEWRDIGSQNQKILTHEDTIAKNASDRYGLVGNYLCGGNTRMQFKICDYANNCTQLNCGSGGLSHCRAWDGRTEVGK